MKLIVWWYRWRRAGVDEHLEDAAWRCRWWRMWWRSRANRHPEQARAIAARKAAGEGSFNLDTTKLKGMRSDRRYGFAANGQRYFLPMDRMSKQSQR